MVPTTPPTIPSRTRPLIIILAVLAFGGLVIWASIEPANGPKCSDQTANNRACTFTESLGFKLNSLFGSR
jgi:hypothetical protein